MNEYEIPLILSSAISAGAINKNDLGSSFEVVFQPPIHFPSDIQSCSLSVQEALVWNVIPNISEQLGNNKLYVIYQATTYDITIPDGLYSVSDLNNAIERELSTETGVSNLVSIEPDNATQRIVLTLSEADLQVDFTQPDTFRDVLGFDSQLVPPAPTTGPYFQLGDSQAAFNNINYFLLHIDTLIENGIRVNDQYNQNIAQILITAAPAPPNTCLLYTSPSPRDS